MDSRGEPKETDNRRRGRSKYSSEEGKKSAKAAQKRAHWAVDLLLLLGTTDQ